MIIAVVSDTHGKMLPTESALQIIRGREVDMILHCGDIGGAGLIELFADWPTHFVFGNVDQDRTTLHHTIESAGQKSHGTFGDLVLAGKRIAFLHGDDKSRLRETINSGQWDLVCYGHTHRKEILRVSDAVVLNPGALFRAHPRTFALVELPMLEIEFLEIP